MSVGLRKGTVLLLPYQKSWEQEFETEKAVLLRAFPHIFERIEHIGSTSVVGLSAKPIIDIDATVQTFDVIDQHFIKKLEVLGYECIPERMFDERKFFPKGPAANRTHHLNIVLKSGQKIQQDIAFRDMLRHNSHAKGLYQKQKEQLASQYSHDRAKYTKEKERIIQKLLGIGPVKGR